jgi:hypothetical protein
VVDAHRSLPHAIELLRKDLRPGDVVLVKGRDTEKLERIALALGGTTVGCQVSFCDADERCMSCPMLARGWPGRDTGIP